MLAPADLTAKTRTCQMLLAVGKPSLTSTKDLVTAVCQATSLSKLRSPRQEECTGAHTARSQTSTGSSSPHLKLLRLAHERSAGPAKELEDLCSQTLDGFSAVWLIRGLHTSIAAALAAQLQHVRPSGCMGSRALKDPGGQVLDHLITFLAEQGTEF